MIGVLVFVDGGGEDEARADAANDRGEGERVRERRYEVGVAAEIVFIIDQRSWPISARFCQPAFSGMPFARFWSSW